MIWDRGSLPWLPPAPDDFRVRCKALTADATDLGREIRALASFRLNADQLASLSKAIRRLDSERADFGPLGPVTLRFH